MYERYDDCYGDTENPYHRFDAKWPTGGGSFRTVVFVHGGFDTGDKSAHLGDCAALVANPVVAAFTINYDTSAGNLYVGRDDIKLAVDFIKTLDCVNPNKVIIVAPSAGGIYSALMVNAYKNVKALITYDTPWDRVEGGNPPLLESNWDIARGSISEYDASPINSLQTDVPYINIRSDSDQIVTEDVFSQHLGEMHQWSREIRGHGNHVLAGNSPLYTNLRKWLAAEASLF